MNIASLISAAAASVAAVLAGLNLYYSGRREEARWKREVLLDVFQEYLGASFEVSFVARFLAGFPREHATLDVDEIERRLKVAHETKLSLLTKLRLLANRHVVEAAISMHREDVHFIESMRADPRPSQEGYQLALDKLHGQREIFLLATRQALMVRGPIATVDNATQPSGRTKIAGLSRSKKS